MPGSFISICDCGGMGLFMGNAFISGIEPGGLNSAQEIRVLICYMLDGISKNISRQAVMDILSGQGIANFFEANQAIDELMEFGHIEETGDSLLRASATGSQIAQDLSHTIPAAIREKAIKLALYTVARARIEKENSVKIDKQEKGYSITCTMHDGSIPLLSFTMKVADMAQARIIREKFLENPELLYRSMIGILTGNAVMSHIHSRITIDLI